MFGAIDPVEMCNCNGTFAVLCQQRFIYNVEAKWQ